MAEYYLTTTPNLYRAGNGSELLVNIPIHARCCAFIKGLHYNNTLINLKITNDFFDEYLNKEYLDFYLKEMKKIGISFELKDKNLYFNTDQVKNVNYKVFVIFTLLRFPFKYHQNFNRLMKTVFDIKRLYPKLNFFKMLYISHLFNNVNTSSNGLYSNMYLPINNITKKSLNKDLFGNVLSMYHSRSTALYSNNFCRGILYTDECWNKLSYKGKTTIEQNNISNFYSKLLSEFNQKAKPSDLKEYVKFFQDYNNKVLKQIT